MAGGLDAGKYFWRSGREKCFSLDIPFNGTLLNNALLSAHFRIADDPPETGSVAFPTKAQLVFAESHDAAVKHTVIRVEKTMGVVKAYLQLKAVTATKQMASAHAILRTRAKVSAGSPPSSHANTAANKRNTEKKRPNALKKSQ